MEEFQSLTSTAMRDLVSVCVTPVVVLLLLAVVFAACCLAWLVAEYFTERRHFKVFLPRLVDDLRASVDGPAASSQDVIKKSGLLLRQKRYLLELTLHPAITANMRESMAVDVEYRERRHYDGIVKITDLLARIAPMLGLLGTLIPLGPGIMALGSGDTETLSQSLLTAFDTTSLGLIAACFALLISAIRKRWYKDYLTSFDAAMECVLEVEKLRWGAQGSPAAAFEVAASDGRAVGVDELEAADETNGSLARGADAEMVSGGASA